MGDAAIPITISVRYLTTDLTEAVANVLECPECFALIREVRLPDHISTHKG